ncbi:MAG TPA: hypothetical protein VGC40_07150 [Paenirhodobacter sp.]
MDVIRFCRDGVLRRTFGVDNRHTGESVWRRIPFRVWEDAIDADAFLKALSANVLFEDGLTVGELMKNLAPWAETMTGVACMDFPAFLAEVMHEPENRQEELSHIALRYSVTIEPVPGFEDRKMQFRKRKDGLYTLARSKPVRTGRLRIQEGWDSHAIVKSEHRDGYDGAESISLSFAPMSEWKHLPILVAETGIVSDETAMSGSTAYLGTRKTLTRKDHPNVEARVFPNGQRASHEIRIDAPLPTFFDTIVHGFLWDVGFHYTPTERDRIGEDLREQVAKIDAGNVEAEEAERDRQNRKKFEAGLKTLDKLEVAASRMGIPLTEL